MAEKILVVDDDLDTLRLVGLLLQRKGYEIVAADNGPQAIEKALSEHPDLILLDVMMPEMDGIEVLRRLRIHTETSETPIILFTAKTQVDDKVTGFEAGADDYLTKPTHPAELTARVKTILARSAGKRHNVPVSDRPQRGRGKMVCVLGAKGGLGVTTVALNTAVLLQKKAARSTVFVEMRPGLGSVGLMLDLPVNGNLAAILRKESRSITEIDVQNALVEDESGLKLLLSSYQPADGRYMAAADQMCAVVEKLAMLFDEVVIDLGTGLPPSTARIVEKCDRIIVVTEPVNLTLVQTRALLDEIRMKVLGLGAIQLVLLNRTRLDGHVPIRDVQNQLGHPVTAVIAPAPEAAYQALVEKRPQALISPSGAFAQQLFKVVEALTSP